VIRQGDRRETSVTRPLRYLIGRYFAIGRRGMAVQVSARRTYSPARSRTAAIA
jgi:hypothetical protein